MKDKFQGKAEEIRGRVTGNKVEESRGKARQKAGETKAKLNRKTEELRQDTDQDTYREK